MSATKFSLFDDLTNVSGDYGATALIKYLVQIISHDVCAINRNTLSYYRLVHRVGEIYKAINALIGEVEKDDTDQWDNYIKYTDAIDPLEGFLFDIAIQVATESTLTSDKDSVKECIDFVAVWFAARNKLQSLPADLQSLVPGLPADDKDTAIRMQKHDESNLLLSICADIKKHALQDSTTTGGYVGKVKRIAEDILSNLPTATRKLSNDSTGLSVRCTMLIHAVMNLSRRSSTVMPEQEKDERKKEKQMLMSSEVWDKAQNLLIRLGSHLKGGNGACSLKELQDLYDGFVTFLEALNQALPVEKLPAAFLEIKRSAHKVMRPYHSQTIQLVSQCRTLADHFLGNNNAKNLETLVAALGAVVNALKKATNAMNKIEQHTESDVAVKAFANARAELEKCFKQYDMESGASERSKNMEVAQKKDKERLEQLNTRFSKGDTSKPASLSLIKVTLKANGKPDVTYETEDTTTLSAILWKRAQNEPSLLQGHFEHIASGKRERERIGHHNQVGQIGGTGSTRILYLVPT